MKLYYESWEGDKNQKVEKVKGERLSTKGSLQKRERERERERERVVERAQAQRFERVGVVWCVLRMNFGVVSWTWMESGKN